LLDAFHGSGDAGLAVPVTVIEVMPMIPRNVVG